MDFSMDYFRLDGQVALVTGASRGLGQAMAVALAKAGADIVGASTKAEQAETRALVEAEGKRFLGVACDVGAVTSEEIEKLANNIENEFGQVSVLVNNAGIIRRSPATEFSDEDWNDVINVNLNGLFRLSRGFGRRMVAAGGGKIINLASLLSFSGGITVPSYAASKGAVMQLTKALSNEWASQNVQVNAIAPGYIATDNTAALRADPIRNADILSRIPIGRWGKPSDLMGVVVFLASSGSTYVNGHVLAVDGGFLGR